MRDKRQKLNIYVVALLIISIFSTAIFGVKVLYMLIAAILSSALLEFVFAKVKKEKMNFVDWLVTPILFVLFVPVTVPIWLVVWGTIFAVLFGKLLFGGEGRYIFNPALVGILFVTISFPLLMNDTSFTANILSQNGPLVFKDLLMGTTNGMVGETFRALLIFLGIILIAFEVIDWKIPVIYLGSFFFFTTFANFVGMQGAADPINSLFVGTLILGAFFVAPDEPTVAKYPIGKVIYAVGLGFFTFLIRTMSAFPEGTVFAIVLMNSLAPLIDKIEQPRLVVEDEEEVINSELLEESEAL